MAEPLLEIRGLKTHFATDDGMVQAVDGVDLTIGRGETLGVVGESGCGKTVTALSVLKLIAMPPGRIVAAEFVNDGRAYRAVLFRDDEGNDGYYSLDGSSRAKAFPRPSTPKSFTISPRSAPARLPS